MKFWWYFYFLKPIKTWSQDVQVFDAIYLQMLNQFLLRQVSPCSFPLEHKDDPSYDPWLSLYILVKWVVQKHIARTMLVIVDLCCSSCATLSQSTLWNSQVMTVILLDTLLPYSLQIQLRQIMLFCVTSSNAGNSTAWRQRVLGLFWGCWLVNSDKMFGIYTLKHINTCKLLNYIADIVLPWAEIQ